MHGHTYQGTLYVSGELDPILGWVLDFADLKAAWRPLEKQLDHHVLNDIPGLENPTAENLAIWIWDKIKPGIPQLSLVEVCENPTNGVRYNGS
jgi:6-pyruvoyltetrahydropterin/6-carboxytetrahydropterin synthase